MKRKQLFRSHIVAYILIIVGLLLLSIWKIHSFLYNRALSLSDLIRLEQPSDKYMELRPELIEIPSVLTLPIVEARKIEGAWTISPRSANHVYQSAVPGSNGNIIIYGHNTDAVFGKLLSVKRGDKITLRSVNGIVHKFIVVNTDDVDVSKIDLLQPTVTETLTLYTCTGWFDSRRFVVRAVPSY